MCSIWAAATAHLMSLLVREKNASVQGIELDDEAVHRCVEKGLTVFQGDIESGLADYPDQSFDDVILNQSMQEVRKGGFCHPGMPARGEAGHRRIPEFCAHRVPMVAFLPGPDARDAVIAAFLV